MGKNRSKTGFPGNQSHPWNRNGGTHQNTSSSGKQIQSKEQVNALAAQASEKLSPEDIEAIDSSPPDDFEQKDLWQKAQIFNLEIKRLESESQQLESQKQKAEALQNELHIRQSDLDKSRLKLDEESKLLYDKHEQLNQRFAEISQRERQLQEQEANAAAGFLAQNRVALSQLEQ